MAFPQIAGIQLSNESTSVGTHDVTLPAGIQAGDLIIAWIFMDGDSRFTWPSPWQEIQDANVGSNVACSTIAYLIASGGETTVAVTSETVNERSTHIAARITGWHGTTPPEISTSATGSSTTPNPDSLNPTAWDVEDTLWIAWYACDSGTATAYPLPDNNTASETTASAGYGAICSDELAQASLDPGTFTNSTSDNWRAGTIAVRPAATSVTTVRAHAQAQADIKQTYNSHGQSNSDIKQVYNQHGQANADIKQTYPLCTGDAGSGDGAILGSDTAILGTIILGSSSSGGGQTCIGPFGQAQASISKTQFVHGQAQSGIKQTYFVHGQSQATIQGSINVHGQAQASIKQVYTVHGQAQSDIKQTYFGLGQSQALLGAIYYGAGQAQASIKTTYVQHGQAQSSIKQVYNVHGQSQGTITTSLYAHGQAQAKINSFGNNKHGQANANIKQTYPLCTGTGGSGDGAILGSDTAVLGTVVLGSASSGGSQICEGAFGQAQATIQGSKFVHGQSQGQIKQTYYVHGQSQALIGGISLVYGQAQGSIKQVYNQHGQSQSWIEQTYNAHGQSQATISSQNVYLSDTFTRTRTFGTGLGTPDIGPTWIHPAPSDDDEVRVINGAVEVHGGDNWTYHYVNAYSDLNINNFDYFVDFRIETYSSRVYSFILLSPINIPDPTGLYMSNVNEWTLYDKSSPDAVINFTTNANTWYRVRLQLQGGNVRFKIWDVNTPQPLSWMAELNDATTLSSDIQLSFDEGFNDSARILVDNVYIAPFSSATTQYMAGQAQAFIIKSVGTGQAAGAINNSIKQQRGQAQATITGQYAIIDDSFDRVIYLTDGGLNGALGTPNKGEYEFFFSGDRGVVSFNDRLEFLPFIDGGDERTLDFGVLLDASNFTAFIEFYSDTYSINDFLEIFVKSYDFNEYADFWWDSGTLSLETDTDSSNTSFTLVNGTTYRMMLFADSVLGIAKAKMWDASTPEPDWMLQAVIVPTTFSLAEIFPDINVSSINDVTYTKRIWVYSTEAPPRPRFGQARALISVPTKNAFGQAKANIKATINRSGQAQAFIRKSAGYGQAQATITRAQFRSGQAQAYITNRFPTGQAQAFITTTRPNGQAQAWVAIRNINNVAQTQALILQKQWAMGQAQAQITAFGFNVSGQAQALITGNVHNAYGQTMAWIKSVTRSYGQAQAMIASRSSGQAQAQIKRTNRNHGLALATIKRTNNGFGQAQAYVQGGTVRNGHGQTQGYIRYQLVAVAQAQAMIRKGAGYGQAQARIAAFGQASFGNAQGFIRRTDTNYAFGQSAGQIKRNDPVGQAQALIAGGRYLVKYNSYQLPGYAQVEDYDSTEGIYEPDVSYQNGPFSEYTGLENKTISLDMTVIGDSYLSVKNQVQEAATIAHGAKTWTKLYIQRYDRYYTALNEKVQTQKVVGTSMRFLTYGLSFTAKPWLESDTVNTISGVGTVDTGTRSLDNGGWTPARVKISGTNVTVSGYTAAGEFTGFISVSGTVTDMIIDSEEYTSTINGVNSENQMYNPDYALFVAPGTTYFEINGASDCEIQYRDRWYL